MKLCKKIFVLFITLYQAILAPYITPCCKFQPTCSDYTKKAIIKYGIIKGTWLGIKRLLCCHPYGKSGYDPVP